jgi:hypothetical protein
LTGAARRRPVLARSLEKLLGDSELREQGAVAGPLIELLSLPRRQAARLGRASIDDFLEFGPIAQVAICKAIGERKDWEGHRAPARAPRRAASPSRRALPRPIRRPSYLEGALGGLAGVQARADRSRCRSSWARSSTRAKQAEEWIEEQGGVRKLRREAEGR